MKDWKPKRKKEEKEAEKAAKKAEKEMKKAEKEAAKAVKRAEREAAKVKRVQRKPPPTKELSDEEEISLSRAI